MLCRENHRARVRSLFSKHANLLSPSRNLSPSTWTHSCRSEAFHRQQEIISSTTRCPSFLMKPHQAAASGYSSTLWMEMPQSMTIHSTTLIRDTRLSVSSARRAVSPIPSQCSPPYRKSTSAWGASSMLPFPSLLLILIIMQW